MNKQTFTYLLEHPEHITHTQTSELRAIVDQFPFFQSAQALYLKGLKNQESFAYNKALKVTAAHTADRAVLFDYITSKTFTQQDISEQIKVQEQQLRGLVIKDLTDVSVELEGEELSKAHQILDPDLFVEKEDSEMTASQPESILSVGQPLEFSKSETHSFGEWLQLSSFKPIVREQDHKTESQEVEKEAVENAAQISRKRKQEIIDTFIERNPKIVAGPTNPVSKKNLAKENLLAPEALMTETLARVYIEQKNYKKAKQAYRILSLKYPEKSGFFADQIRAVEQLEVNKEL